MRIVDYETFGYLPVETVYCICSPCTFGDLSIKGESIIHEGNFIDWFYTELVSNPEYDSDIFTEAFDPMIEGIEIPPDFYIQQRDGMYDHDRTFMIYSKEDIKNMMQRLKEVIDENTN